MDRLRNTACNYIFVTNFFKLFLNIPTAYIPVLQLNTSHLLHQVEYGAGLWIRIHILRIQLFFSVRNFATFTYCNEVIWRHFLQTIRQNVTICLYKHFTKLCLRKLHKIMSAKVSHNYVCESITKLCLRKYRIFFGKNCENFAQQKKLTQKVP